MEDSSTTLRSGRGSFTELLAGTIACRWFQNKNCAGLIAGVVCWLAWACTPMQQEAEKLPFYNSANFDAEWINNDDPQYTDIHTIDTFTFFNQLGQPIGSANLSGHIYVANFFFTSCPSICPKMTQNMHLLQDAFAGNDDVLLVSFSVTPWIDSVARLREYATTNQIDASKWHLLTGSKEPVYALARHSFFAEKSLGLQKDDNEFLHTESMLLVDRKGRIRGIYNATQEVEIERITEDIRTLMQE